MEYTDAQGQVVFVSRAWRRLFEIQGLLLRPRRREMSQRQFILALGLHTAEEMATNGFEAYWTKNLREITSKANLHDYWSRIAFDGGFLSTFPSYTYIRDPLRRLCHRLIAFSISGRCLAPKKVTATDLFYLRSMDEGTMLNERLQGLTVVVQDLTKIDMDGLVRLRICERLLEILTWVALRPERQQSAMARAAQVDQEILKEGILADPTPTQATRIPSAASAPRTMPQRMARLEEEVHELR
ncbi:hypothetical protein Tco_1140763 [Tanacetum coccineum]